MLLLELAHVVGERPHAIDRHRVVDRRAHAADRAVALELHHPALLRALEEGLVELLVGQSKRNVHARAVFLLCRARVELRSVDAIVQKTRLGDVLLLDRREAAFAEQAGVLTIESPEACCFQWKTEGVIGSARSSKSSRTMSSVRPAMPAFFC